KVFGYEALLRGLDEQGKLIMPGRIFELADDAGLLAQLDLAARRTAIQQASHHGITDRIFINFSPSAIYDPVSCLQTTVQTIDDAGIPHESIVFEVVESDQSQDQNHLQSILTYYRNSGFKVALDDFGAGYSSLNLLHQIRPDLLKLDMDLIRNVHQDTYKALITEKILEIAQRLEILTVAEGIESEEELCWLRDRGATFVQGFYIAKPSATPAAVLSCELPEAHG
ncbi:EAL domain-containing protein, partial [Leptolyngbya sp. FACHB-36]|uniref:EAL domain-containing protein n=1 Tax=Leptolyngbya sp. FACHB-36 TaxID=2692808 RepID=UPI0016812F74